MYLGCWVYRCLLVLGYCDGIELLVGCVVLVYVVLGCYGVAGVGAV